MVIIFRKFGNVLELIQIPKSYECI